MEVAAGVGGAKLTRSPKDITLLDVFRAVEEDEDLFHFQENPNPDCPVGRNIHRVLGTRLERIKQHMMEDLAGITLEELLHAVSEDQIYTRAC